MASEETLGLRRDPGEAQSGLKKCGWYFLLARLEEVSVLGDHVCTCMGVC